MISNQVLQNTLEGLKEISRTEFCIIDTEGKVLATTFADFSIQPGDIQAFVESQADSQLVKGFQYFKVCDDYQLVSAAVSDTGCSWEMICADRFPSFFAGSKADGFKVERKPSDATGVR